MNGTVYISGYGCSTSAGPCVKDFWTALLSGPTRKPVLPNDWEQWPQRPDRPIKVFRWPDRERGAADLIAHHLEMAINECLDPSPVLDENLGVIFCSTKGNVEDWVWQSAEPLPDQDPLSPVLEQILNLTGLKPRRTLCVSSACSSSHVAMDIASTWLKQAACKEVLVLSADTIGPFIANGFALLKALSADTSRPFTGARDGLVLGEAAAAIRLTLKPQPICLQAAATISEGFAATRPSERGDGLRAAIARATEAFAAAVDGVIAHGTGTLPNDATEDSVFAHHLQGRPLVTSIKWAVGHCMGASGALDIIAACEALRRHQLPAMPLAGTASSLGGGRYVFGEPVAFAGESILTTSLGFGGINAASIISTNKVVEARTNQQSQSVASLGGLYCVALSDDDLNFQSRPPRWGKKVERWYQFDAAALALPQACELLELDAQDLGAVFLSSPSGSNRTDRDFAASGACSPAKFVHTLPNIRMTGLLQLTGWRGPVYTLQGGERSLGVALREAELWVRAHGKFAWIIYYDDTAPMRNVVIGSVLPTDQIEGKGLDETLSPRWHQADDRTLLKLLSDRQIMTLTKPVTNPGTEPGIKVTHASKPSI